MLLENIKYLNQILSPIKTKLSSSNNSICEVNNKLIHLRSLVLHFININLWDTIILINNNVSWELPRK